MIKKTMKRILCCIMMVAMVITLMPAVSGSLGFDSDSAYAALDNDGLSVKNLWASQHDKGRVLFKWSVKSGAKADSWNLKYRYRKIGGNNKWTGWTNQTVTTKGNTDSNGNIMAWVKVNTDYVIEIHAQGKGDSTWSRGIITCPAGGKYQAMKTTYVTNTATGKHVSNTITIDLGKTIKVKPDYEYSVKNYKKRPRLYPNHLLYDVEDTSLVKITKPDGSTYTGGIIDGVATITGVKAGTTTLIFRAPNGRTQVVNLTVNGRNATEQEKSKYNTYVFFGSDSRANDSSWKQKDVAKGKKSWTVIDKSGTEGTPRSDVIMLLQVDEKNKQVNVVSVLRDSLLDISGKGSNFAKANRAYAEGGPYNAIDMLEKNLDIHINGYVSTNFKGVADMIDSLGGVTIDIEDEPLMEGHIVKGKLETVADAVNSYISEMNGKYGTNTPKIKAGKQQKLTGIQAVAYARVRYSEGYDMRRAQRQRVILRQMISQYNSAANDKKASALADNFSSIDTDLTQSEMMNLINKASKYKVVEYTFPFYKRFDTIYSKGEDEGGTANVFVPADLAKNVTVLHNRVYNENWYKPSTTVQSYSDKMLKIKNTSGKVMNYTYDNRDKTYDNY